MSNFMNDSFVPARRPNNDEPCYPQESVFHACYTRVDAATSGSSSSRSSPREIS